MGIEEPEANGSVECRDCKSKERAAGGGCQTGAFRGDNKQPAGEPKQGAHGGGTGGCEDVPAIQGVEGHEVKEHGSQREGESDAPGAVFASPEVQGNENEGEAPDEGESRGKAGDIEREENLKPRRRLAGNRAGEEGMEVQGAAAGDQNADRASDPDKRGAITDAG